MNDKQNPADNELMRGLGAALEVHDAPPASVLDAARGVYTWRTIDAELAELVFDSAIDELVGVRSSTGERQMTFQSPALRIEIMIGTDGTRQLIGQLDPPSVTLIELRQGESVTESVPDDLGRFAFDNVAPGPVNLRCRLGDGSIVSTEWTVV